MNAFEPDLSVWLERWRLVPDGAVVETRSSRLLPVRTSENAPAMLKLAAAPEERAGARLMVWWDGLGAARVLAHEGDALLLERATKARSLAGMAFSGAEGDDEATRILCAAASALHAPRREPPPHGLVPLDVWFASLLAKESEGGLLGRCAATARDLLAAPQDVAVLYGDLHHGNVLDFGSRGWLAIDPKGLIGERFFDYANIFRNPAPEAALAPSRFARRVDIVTDAANLDRTRLLDWIAAWCALSEVWMVEDGLSAAPDLRLAELAFTASR